VLSIEETPKPLCVIFEYASGLFPSGKLGNLGELDRQRVLALTGWLDDPRFQMGANILMLISETNAELSDLIVGHRAMESISVRRPDEAARRRFVEKRGAEVQFDGTLDQFIKDCEGLHLVGIQDLLLEALYTGKPVSRKAVLVRINQMLKDELGEDVAEQFLPSYGPEAIIGNEEAVKRLQQMLIRADRRPEKAARVLLVTGPNGGGKTFVTQGCLPDDRVVLLLKAMRDSEYGETEKRVEKLRYFFEMFPRLLVLVDEADTWFGQVSGRNTHEVDRRMTGSFLQMMTDKTLFVLFWLATARPKGLPPDLISRAAIQIPILDLAGEERKKFVKEMFHRDGIGLEAATLDSLMEHSTHWSARDYRHFLEEFGDAREDDNTLTVDTMVTQWQAPYAIVGDRELQTLHAIQYCSYPSLIPIEYRGSAGQEKLQAQIAVLEARLNR
jgi:AAA+ superfamily predicted ATPase